MTPNLLSMRIRNLRTKGAEERQPSETLLFLVLFLLLVFPNFAFAQERGGRDAPSTKAPSKRAQVKTSNRPDPKPKPAGITLAVRPPDSTLLIDGELSDKVNAGGIAELTNLKVGQHRLTVRHLGYNETQQVVDVKPGNIEPISITLEPLKGTLSVAAFVSLPQAVLDTQFETLDGKSLKLSDYANKVVVLNIWATWCGPCRLEMPGLSKMSNEYKSRGVVILGLATTYNEHNDLAHVKEYLRTQRINYRIIWDDGTLAVPLVEAVNGRSVIPQSFVISRDGRIVKHFQGFNPYSTPQLMRQAIDEALSVNRN
jgi:thiol-disulfide isomerase/thioredoxin